MEKINSVPLLVDISGFILACTQLSPEAARYHIHAYFILMIDITFKFGGDFHKVSVIILFFSYFINFLLALVYSILHHCYIADTSWIAYARS